jgi:hypothetical protein
MFERIGSLAEGVATDVSRRAFFGRLGQGALGLAAVIGGVLASPVTARADQMSCWCCSFAGRSYLVCSKTPYGCGFVHAGCKGCKGPCNSW